MLLYIQSFKTTEFWEIAFSMGSTFVDIKMNLRGKNEFFLLNSAISKPFCNQSVNSKAFEYTVIVLKSKIYFSWKSWKHSIVCKLLLHFSHTLRQLFSSTRHIFSLVLVLGNVLWRQIVHHLEWQNLDLVWELYYKLSSTQLELQLGRKTSDHLLTLCTIGVIANNIQIQDWVHLWLSSSTTFCH